MKIIGGSIIGHPCDRFIWIQAQNPNVLRDEKTEEIFAEGRRLEQVVINQIREGLTNGEVLETETPEGRQFWVHHPDTNLIGGFVDGILTDKNGRYVIEIKSANDKNFNQFKKHTIRIANKQYFSQLNCYIRWGDFDYGVWYVINKETNEIYTEWLKFNQQTYNDDNARALHLLDMGMPPKMSISNCRWCNVKHICSGKLPEPDCRQCAHAYIDVLIKPYDWICVCKNHIFGNVCDDFMYRDAYLTNSGFRKGEFWVADDHGKVFSVCDLKESKELKHMVDFGFSAKAKQNPEM